MPLLLFHGPRKPTAAARSFPARATEWLNTQPPRAAQCVTGQAQEARDGLVSSWLKETHPRCGRHRAQRTALAGYRDGSGSLKVRRRAIA
jgi:hypothetical protein